MRAVLPLAAVGVVAVAVALVALPAAAEDVPPAAPIPGEYDVGMPPPGSPTTDVIGEPPPPPPLTGDFPPPELPAEWLVPVPPPEPCYAGGGPLSLRISPSYALVTPTQSVTLSARLMQNGRACQAGVRVPVYARGPGATVFHLSRTLTTDASGLVRTTYVRPSADFRWYVKAMFDFANAASPTGLVQVRR